MMTRKHFQDLAAILGKSREQGNHEPQLERDLQVWCLKMNPQFDAVRFQEAIRNEFQKAKGGRIEV